MKIFISHCINDKNKVVSLTKAIKKSTMKLEPIVVANKRNPLLSLANKVEKNLKDSNIIIPIITSTSMNNQWVNQEIGYANAIGKQIVPIVEEGILMQLKGFIHSQLDLPYLFKSDEKNKIRESTFFAICCKQLVLDIENGNIKSVLKKKDIKIEDDNNPNFIYQKGFGSGNPEGYKHEVTTLFQGNTIELLSKKVDPPFRIRFQPDRFIQKDKLCTITIQGPSGYHNQKEISFELEYKDEFDQIRKSKYIYYVDQNYIKLQKAV
jgi:hypothetical protein